MNLFRNSKKALEGVHNAPEKSHKPPPFRVWASDWPSLTLASCGLHGTVDLSGRPVLSSRTGNRKASSFVLAYQAFERFAYFGVSANLVIYMTSELHKDLVSSVTSVNNWSGTAWITPILGAYIADSYLGRFWTISFALLIYGAAI
ncbi:NRT1/ PTR FAMILY 5.1 [Spatholobus suberectus]|nr:NRT1/ PTR FAMILY 5.1 [Spatholobus suberectus]